MSGKPGSKDSGEVSGSSCTIIPASTDSVANDSYNFTATELIELDPETAEKVVQSAIVQEGDTAGEPVNMSSTSSDSGVKPSWQHSETLRLIRLYKEHQGFFEDHRYKKKAVWAMLSAKLTQGCGKTKRKYTALQAYNRWKNLTKLYRDNVRFLEQTGYLLSKPKNMYFHELDAIFGMSSKASPTGIAGVSDESAHRNSALSQQSVQESKPELSGQASYMGITSKVLPVGVTPSGPSPKIGVSSSGLTTPVIVINENMLSVSKCEQTSFREVVHALNDLYRDKERTDLWKLEKLEQMHREKMQVFTEFLNMLHE